MVEFESLEALQAHAKISGEVKAVVKAVKLYKDGTSKTVYAMAVLEDIILQDDTSVGGVGGGHLLDSDPEKGKAIMWSMPDGDKTCSS